MWPKRHRQLVSCSAPLLLPVLEAPPPSAGDKWVSDVLLTVEEEPEGAATKKDSNLFHDDFTGDTFSFVTVPVDRDPLE